MAKLECPQTNSSRTEIKSATRQNIASDIAGMAREFDLTLQRLGQIRKDLDILLNYLKK